MSEKEKLISVLQRETGTTVKVLKAYHGDLAMKPAEKSRTAKELADTFIGEMIVAKDMVDGTYDFSKEHPDLGSTMEEITQRFESAVAELIDKIGNASEEDLGKEMEFAKMKMRRSDAIWSMVMDQIHHRGQFSVYLRIAGDKVPSIYGPTADETWN